MCSLWGDTKSAKGERLDRTFSKVYSCKLIDNKISVEGALAGVSHSPYFCYTLTVTVDGDGRICYSLKGKVREDISWLPRLGFEFILPKDNKTFTYYGYGPNESYCDMHHASLMGMYCSNADDEYVNYVVPQEHGNHYNVKMLEIGDMCVLGDRFEANVSKYSSHALDRARHTDELHSDGFVHLRIDYKNSGLGSNSCGPQLDEKYRLKEKEICFDFIISHTNK